MVDSGRGGLVKETITRGNKVNRHSSSTLCRITGKLEPSTLRTLGKTSKPLLRKRFSIYGRVDVVVVDNGSLIHVLQDDKDRYSGPMEENTYALYCFHEFHQYSLIQKRSSWSLFEWILAARMSSVAIASLTHANQGL